MAAATGQTQLRPRWCGSRREATATGAPTRWDSRPPVATVDAVASRRRSTATARRRETMWWVPAPTDRATPATVAVVFGGRVRSSAATPLASRDHDTVIGP